MNKKLLIVVAVVLAATAIFFRKKLKSLIEPMKNNLFGLGSKISDSFLKPVTGKVSSFFGMRKGKMHSGVDFACPIGTEVKAPAHGVIHKIWEDNTYGGGLSMQVKHAGGVMTGYAHLSETLKKVGMSVNQGEVIALSGNSGSHTSGAHLHFTFSLGGKKVDPLNYLT